MTVWKNLGQLLARVSGAAVAGIVEAVRTVFEGDPETRRRVAFSVAMIALSAKMAKADGVVTQDEVRAFEEIFSIPKEESRNVRRLYSLAMEDVAGYESYAQNMARLCGTGERNCPFLEDILDGLFHIAKADGVVHEKEVAFLGRVAEIFGFDETRFEQVLARHVDLGEADPYRILGVTRSMDFEAIRKHYRGLVRENHPDKLVARGVPPEFVTIANDRLAAINEAYRRVEQEKKVRA
jgi:DnaJ like chaperone protein